MSNEKETKVSALDAKAKALANEEDEDTKIAKLLKNMPKWRFYSLAVLTVIWTVFQLYIKLVKPLDPWFQLPLHMCLALVVVWLYNPMVEKSKSHNKLWWIYDIFLIASSCFICWFFLSHAEQLNYRIFNVDVMTTTEVIVAVLLVINVMEAVRRVVSMSLFWVICFFLAYAWFGQYIPGLFRFSGISFPKLMEVLMYGENGIFGSPLVTSLGTLFYFLVFGTFFSNCGGGGVLIDGGMKLSDKTVGGPAKAAVISSGLLGMVSGSAIANVSTTGVLTIPLMKKTGYDPEEAAAVESVASTGGQIMPPIMGAGAFIMAEIIGVQYAQIAAAAVLPAVAYFLAVFILVHMIAKKKGLGKDSGVHYEGKPILPRVYRLLPIIVLVIMIIMGYSLPRSAIYCTIFSIIIAAISPETRMGPRKLLQTLMDGVRQAANIAIPTAACGIMIGIVVNSGVAVKIAKLIGTSGEGQPVHRTVHRRSGLPAAGHGTAYRGRLPDRCHSVRIGYPGSGHLRSGHQYVHLLLRCRGSDHSSRLSGILYCSRHRGCKRMEDRLEGILLRHHRFHRPLCIRVSSRYPAGRHDGGDHHCILHRHCSHLSAGLRHRWLPVPSPEDVGAHRLLCRGLHLHPAQLHV